MLWVISHYEWYKTKYDFYKLKCPNRIWITKYVKLSNQIRSFFGHCCCHLVIFLKFIKLVYTSHTSCYFNNLVLLVENLKKNGLQRFWKGLIFSNKLLLSTASSILLGYWSTASLTNIKKGVGFSPWRWSSWRGLACSYRSWAAWCGARPACPPASRPAAAGRARPRRVWRATPTPRRGTADAATRNSTYKHVFIYY